MSSRTQRTYRDELYAWFGRTGRRPPYRTYSDDCNQFICVLSSPEDGITTHGRGLRRAQAEEEAARKFVESLERGGRWIEDNASRPVTSPTQPVSDGPLPPETNPKTLLNIYLQNSLRVSNPGTYTSYPIDSGRFRCRLDIELPSGSVTFTADGPSKTEAEKTCAKKALAEFRRHPPPEANVSRVPVKRAVSLPPSTLPPSTTVPRQKWNPRRPEPKNPCSLLNEFLQQNAIANAGYKTSDRLCDGDFNTSCTIDLKDHGRQLHQSATGASKAESKKKCAEKLIEELEKLHLIDVEERRPAPAVSDEARNMSVEQTLDASVPLPRSSLSDIPGPVSHQERSYDSSGPTQTLTGPQINNSPNAVQYVINYPSGPIPAPPLATDAVPSTMPHRARRQSLNDLFESTVEVDDRQILLVSKHIGKFRKTIGLELGLSEADIDNCVYREDDPYEVNRRILRRWRQKESRSATVGKLCSVLWECRAYDAVEELHKLLRDTQ